MPLRLGPSGKTAVGPTGKIERRFTGKNAKKDARAFVAVRNIQKAKRKPRGKR